MHIVRIEHPVPSYEDWKKAFDGDPVEREKSGVRRYRILRPVDDPSYVMIDLEFDTEQEAAAMLGKLRELWGRMQNVATNPQGRIVEIAEYKEY